jgi:Lon protease-like protein
MGTRVLKLGNSASFAMDSAFEPDEFSNLCRLFPLPDLVLFPHALVPLHIFEPRYRQMTEDALAADHMVTMVQIDPTAKSAPSAKPVPIVSVGCLGRIVQHERLSDGRFNFLLLGCRRVRLVREVPTEKLYLIAEAEVMEDHESELPPEPRRGDLVGLFRELLERRNRLNNELSAFLKSDVPLGVLTDIISYALSLPPAVKQGLLAEADVDIRVESLLAILKSLNASEGSARLFPPSFSLN